MKEELNILPKFLKNSIIRIIVILFILALIISPLGAALESYYPQQKPDEITDFKIGDTVLPGMDVVDDDNIRKVPILYHPQYLLDYIQDQRIGDFIVAVVTGTVKTPIARITSGSVSRYGIARGFTGPGMLTVTEGKLTVDPPGSFVYGFKTPYLFGEKTEDGLEIQEGNETIKVVLYGQINNDTVPHNYLSVKRLKRWYDRSDIGDRVALDYAIDDFNDNRNMVPPDKIKLYFGEEVIDYMENYPGGSPILVYTNLTGEDVVGSAGDVLGSYPQYDNSVRIYNAMQFAYAWNGTIIPPHTKSSGKETVGFDSAPDPKAPGGEASHGSCPPARALRGACWEAGFPLPSGMSGEYYAVLFGHNPSTGIFVKNTRDYPVKIIMWTEGEGTGMRIYAKIIELVPA